MNGASVVRLVLIITLLYLNAYLATLNITLASGLHKTMSHHAPGFQQQQVQVQVPRLRPPATDQVLGVGTALGASTCLVLPTRQSVQYCKGNDDCFLGCALAWASRENTKYRWRPMTTKLQTCLRSLNNQWWENWALTEDHSALILDTTALPTYQGFVECDIATEKLRNVLVSILLNLVLIGSLNVFHDDECEIEMKEETRYPVTLRQNKTCSGFILKILFFLETTRTLENVNVNIYVFPRNHWSWGDDAARPSIWTSELEL